MTSRGTSTTWPTSDVVQLVEERIGGTSDVALVLGSGLGGIANELGSPRTLRSGEIPGYPSSTVAGHEGRLHLAEWGGRRIWCVQGRVHLYEGHTPEVATRYVRLLHALGVRTLLLTNAAGSLTTGVQPGEIVLDRDAISLFFQTLAAPASWAGESTGDVGSPNGTLGGTGSGAPPVGAARTEAAGGQGRYASSSLWRCRGALSDPALASVARDVGLELRIPFHEGTLVGGLGPTYETAAEVRAWRRLGGTVASMSTVPEAIQARELGMRVLMFSLVTNLGTGLSVSPLSHAEVVEVADRAGAQLARLLEGIVGRL